jgi:ATP-dependent RNA helicase SUPV3L1/SUV3
MPSWPAQASGECVFCALKHTFVRPNVARPTILLQRKRSLRRNFSLWRKWPRERSKPVDDKWSHKLGLVGVEKGSGSGFRGAQHIKVGRNIENDSDYGFRGARRFEIDNVEKKNSNRWSQSQQIEQVRDAILQQLETLKDRLASEPAKGEGYLAKVAALDPEQDHWRAFEAEIRLLLQEGTKTGQQRKLTIEQWQFYRKLYRAQLPSGRSVILPRAEVRSLLEFAYYDRVIQSDKETQIKIYDPVAEYTDLRYPTEWYAAARSTQRQIHLHVGPTNSGKTYTALKRLEEAGNGYYCGPLRLLAHEVYARFQAKGIPCHLITGDDVRTDPSGDTKLRSSTVEMVDTNTRAEVAVIDEIQMIAHEQRGWAWTRAFLGSNAKEVHLCGETRVVPLVRELAASMGDTLHIHNYQRLSPLKVMSKSLRGNLKLLRKGDCVVSFSILGIHALKKEIERETGRRVAIVYGSLPPETRAKQAELFNDPDNDYDYLVASDAIGMGLNLAVKRMIFESLYKFNGRDRELLSIPQIKQIAGRAGRYRTAKQGADEETTEGEKKPPAPQAIGLVTCMEDDDLPIIRKALDTEPEPIKTAGLLPPAEFVEEYAARLPKGLPFEYIYRKMCDAARIHPRFKLTDVNSQVRIARTLDSVPDLTITDRLIFSASPAETRKGTDADLLVALAKCVSEGKQVTCADIVEVPLEILDEPMSGQREYLQSLELLHKALILYLWLSYRFVGIFKDQAQAMYAKSLTEERINDTLLKFSHSAELKERMMALKRRQIKDSQLISELDGLLGDPLDVLVSNEPSTEEIPLEPPTLNTSSEAEGLIADSGEEPMQEDMPLELSDLTPISLEAQNTQLLYNTNPEKTEQVDSLFSGPLDAGQEDSRPQAAQNGS